MISCPVPPIVPAAVPSVAQAYSFMVSVLPRGVPAVARSLNAPVSIAVNPALSPYFVIVPLIPKPILTAVVALIVPAGLNWAAKTIAPLGIVPTVKLAAAVLRLTVVSK